jgi:hypothetical protein
VRRTLALLDGRAVLGGAGVALAVAVPTVVAGIVLDPEVESNVVFLLWGMVMAGFTLGGMWAAQRQPDAPFANGACAALAAYAVAVVASVVRRLARGESPDLVPLLFNAFMAATFGIIGGLIGGRRRSDAQRPHRR